MFSSTRIESSLNGFGNLVSMADMPAGQEVLQTTSAGTLFATPSNNVVSTFDNDQLEATTSYTESAYQSNVSDCFLIETRNGRSLIVGAGSKLLVANPNTGGLSEVSPANAEGGMVPIWMGSPFVSSTPSNHANFDLAWWYGVLVADGWVSRGVVGYSKDDPKKRQRFREIAERYLTRDFIFHEYHDSGTSKDKYSASTKIHLNGTALLELVEPVNHPDFALSKGELRGALFKMLPRKLLYNGSEECLWGLLSGLLDGDSSLGWNKHFETPRFYAKLNTSSPYLKDDIVFLLRKLGIRCSVTDVPPKGPSQASYIICLSIVSLRSAVQNIRCVGSEENARLSEFSAEYRDRPTIDNLDAIPFPTSCVGPVRTAIGSRNKNPYGTVSKAQNSHYISRQAVLDQIPRTAFDVSAAAKEIYKVASQSRLFWDSIVSVKPANRQRLYNVQVADSKPLILWDGWIVPSYRPVRNDLALLN